MAVSDKELNALLGFYSGLRKVVFVAGIVVLVAAALGLVGAAFVLGRQNGLHLAGDSAKPAPQVEPPNNPPARPRRARHVVTPPPVVEDTSVEETPEAPPPVAQPISRAETPTPSPVGVVVVAAPAEEKHFIAHHKGRGGCDGDLVLTDTNLRFDCPSGPEHELNFERSAISADDDGIKDLASGRCYHFKVSQMDKPQVKAMFNAWVRAGMAAELVAGAR